MTTLNEYLATTGLTDAAIAALVGLNRSTVGRIRRGEIDPRLSTVCGIVDATGGRMLIMPAEPKARRKRP